MQPLIKKVVKCPDKNKFVLRTATRGASFLQRPPAGCGLQGAARRVFFAMKKVRRVRGATPKIGFKGVRKQQLPNSNYTKQQLYKTATTT